MPLCSSGVRARRCRFTMFTPSIVTRPVLGKTRMILPSLPLSSPRTTRTVSPLLTCSRMRVLLSAWRFRLTTRGRSALRCLRILISGASDDLGRQRHALHVPLLAQLARDRSEDTGRPGLPLLVDDDDGVLVEPDVAPVLSPRLLG